MKKGINYIGITAAAIIYQEGKGILFVHRTENCRDERNKRDLIGGGVDFGDTLNTTIKKEIKEEVGLDILDKQIRFLGHREQFRKHEGKQTHRLGFYYLVCIESDQKPNIQEPHKFDDMKFYPCNALPEKENCHSLTYPTLQEYKSIIEEYIQEKIKL